jgi:hypothetical protein
MTSFHDPNWKILNRKILTTVEDSERDMLKKETILVIVKYHQKKGTLVEPQLSLSIALSYFLTCELNS